MVVLGLCKNAGRPGNSNSFDVYHTRLEPSTVHTCIPEVGIQ